MKKPNTQVRRHGTAPRGVNQSSTSPTKHAPASRANGTAAAADIKRLRRVEGNYGEQTPRTLNEMSSDLETQARELRQVSVFVKQRPDAWHQYGLYKNKPLGWGRKPAAAASAAETVKVEPWRDYRQTITLQLTQSEVRALYSFARVSFKADPGNITAMAHIILLLALQRPEVVSNWISGMVRYCAAEGLDQYQFMRALNHPRYRRTKVPGNGVR